MNEIKVEILPDGISCKEVNYFGDPPKLENYRLSNQYPFIENVELFKTDINKWRQTESERKVYRIESPIPIVTDETGVRFKYQCGDVVGAIKIDEQTVKIV
jgi:hypothetical protein